MDSINPNENQWQDCRPGELGGLVENLQARRRSAWNRRAALGVMGICFILAGTSALMSTFSSTNSVRTMSCQEVLKLADDYRDGRLDEETQAIVRQHLEKCEPCRKKMAELEQKDSQQENASTAYLEVESFPFSRPTDLELFEEESRRTSWLISLNR